MIRFSLRCASGHEYEAWFGGNADFDRQREMGLVECPHCGTAEVEKALMAPTIAAGEGRSPPSARDAADGPTAEAARELLARFARHVRAHTTDVGERFPEEVRRIHYGEAEDRAIRGRATDAEARELREEGVAIARLPSLAEDAN